MVSDPDLTQAAILSNAIAEEFINQNKTKFRKNLDDQQAEFEKQMEEISNSIDQIELEISSLSSSIVQVDTEISRLGNLVGVYQNDLRGLEQNEERISLEKIQAADSVMLMEPASPPKKPVQNRLLTIFLAGLVGSMVGVGIAFVLQYLDNKIYTASDVSTVLGLSVLGTIGRRNKTDPELLVGAQHLTPLGEQFSVLSTRILNTLISKSQQKVLLVTSSTPSEGKSFISANLAIAMANMGLRVILIDADLRQPRLHQIFKIRKSKGVADILKKEIWQIELAPTKTEGLKILAGGVDQNNPTQVFNSPKMRDFFYTFKQKSDLIIVDCPPVLSFADTQVLAAYSNGILLVIRSGKVFNQAAQDAKEILEQTGSMVVGVVLNDIHNRSKDNYYYYYGYGKKKRKLPALHQPWNKFKGFLNGAIPQRKKDQIQ
jgi:non-specific protein-tyrosine kinase